ncbi:MAG TPA: ester cyclase [Acidimicrobiales bacterium]|nr:ester cyclase [Acidimicrobiales bacterium]
MTITEENADKTRRYYEALWNRRDRSVIADWIAPDYVGHFTSRPKPIHGVEGFVAMAEGLLGAFPDLAMLIEDQVAEDDQVVSRIRLTGTHEGDFAGVSPTCRSVDVGFVAIERYAEGLCVEEWVYFDDMGLARQLGLLG